MDHYLVISSDCHAGPETPDYKPYIDAQYHDAFERSLVEREAMLAEMRAERGSLLMGGDDEFQEEWFGHDEGEESLHEGGLRCGWDAPKRDQELDNDGVAGEVIFPGPDAATGSMGAPFGAGLVIGADLDPELLLAGARAYNRWCADLCSHSPERRKGLAVAPILGDIDGAVAEIRRAHESGLHGGVLIPAQWGSYLSYAHDVYDPVWAVCEELELPVHTHSGPGAHQDYGTGPGFYGMYVAETRWWTARPLWFLLCSGVFERFPELKFAVTEAGSFWVADLLWMLDDTYNRNHGARKTANRFSNLTMKPSDYFDRNIKIGSSNTRRREIGRRYEIGVDNIMWGNDFPHPEGTWPYTREFLKERFWDVPIDETEKMLGLNHADFYGFDVQRLRPLADRIGPTPEDLGQTDASVFAKWDELRAVGRPWLTGKETAGAGMH
jgi:predicted TIM-barrel fold metal-dependent hydrolase